MEWCANHTNSITIYGPSAVANTTPTATIVGNNTGLDQPAGIARDAAGRLYVANSNANIITVYAAGATGNATPVATIAGSNTSLHNPVGIAVGGGRLYVANTGSDGITIYATAATGNAAPTAAIAGPSTRLALGGPIALDAAGQLYVVNGGYSRRV